MVALGARVLSPFVRVDGLPRSLGARECALGHTDGLPRSSPGCQELWPNLWVHAAAGTCFADEHKAPGRQRAGATQRGAATSVRAYLFQIISPGVSHAGRRRVPAQKKLLARRAELVRLARACLHGHLRLQEPENPRAPPVGERRGRSSSSRMPTPPPLTVYRSLQLCFVRDSCSRNDFLLGTEVPDGTPWDSGNGHPLAARPEVQGEACHEPPSQFPPERWEGRAGSGLQRSLEPHFYRQRCT